MQEQTQNVKEASAQETTRPSYFERGNLVTASLLSILFLAISLVVNWYAGSYATSRASNPVTDIILSNIRVYDVDGIFTYGAVLFWGFTLFLCILKPKRLPYTFMSIGLFILIRSIFISLTHIGPFPTEATIDSTIIDKFSFGGDLFFSGHTGMPFMMALLFWNNRLLRYVFILTAIIFGVVVLLAHLHYSIDVLSAFFITYGIVHIGEQLFKKERKLFESA